MRHLLLQAQQWWDAQRFDQPEWHLAARPDQKVRHIQLHVAKALGKVVNALDREANLTHSSDPMVQVRDEVLPDVAIYRSQLINTLRERGVSTALPCHSPTRMPFASAADVLSHVALLLSRASAQLAAYIEPREHGAMSPDAPVQEAIQHLHDSAEALASYFAVDLAGAQQARLEALLGARIPASLIEP
jgi:hypothetical protein